MSSNLYFAYGSNLCAARLRERAPSALARGAAHAPGFALRLDKRGADGTARANIHPAPGGVVWGAVYALEPGDWARLDACEPDYVRIEIEVMLCASGLAARSEAKPSEDRTGERALAQTYRSDRLAAEAVAAGWYKRLIVDGARAHALPADWCAWLDGLPER